MTRTIVSYICNVDTSREFERILYDLRLSLFDVCRAMQTPVLVVWLASLGTLHSYVLVPLYPPVSLLYPPTFPAHPLQRYIQVSAVND